MVQFREIEWVENNGSFEARINHPKVLIDYVLVSQSPNHPDVADPGKWDVVYRIPMDGLSTLPGKFDTSEQAKEAFMLRFMTEPDV